MQGHDIVYVLFIWINFESLRVSPSVTALLDPELAALLSDTTQNQY